MTRAFFVPLACAVALLAPATATAQERSGKVSEVRESGEYGTTVLVDVGSERGVAAGQTVEVRRDGRTIGYGSVDSAFTDVAVATIGTIVTGASPLRAGDVVVFRGVGFQRPDVAPPPPTPREGTPDLAHGRIVSSHDGLVFVEFAEGEAAEVGMEVSVQDDAGVERGRLSLEMVNGRTGGGVVISGEVRVGDAALATRGARSGGSIDFVALSFLGVVADLEHPTPHRAPCHVGVPVRRIMPGSPAQRAGIGRGDRVIAIDGIVVRDIAAVRERIEARQGDRVQVALIRGDRVMSVDVIFR